MVGSVEYQHQVKGPWWGAVFVDAGNAVNSFSNVKESYIGSRFSRKISQAQILKTSVGFGVVYVSPVGAIEVTLAQPINDIDLPLKLQVTMGTNI